MTVGCLIVRAELANSGLKRLDDQPYTCGTAGYEPRGHRGEQS